MKKRIPLGPDYHAEPGETKGHQHDVYTTKGELHGYTRIHVGTLMKSAVEDLSARLATPTEADIARSGRHAATRVCHEEQMVIWSGEVIEALSMIDFLREDWSYEDTIRANATVANCIRSIVESAFSHPELTPPPNPHLGHPAGEEEIR